MIKYVIIFLCFALIVTFAFGFSVPYVLSEKIGVVQFYSYPNAIYSGRSMLRSVTSIFGFFNKFVEKTYYDLNPRLEPYFLLLEDYKPGFFAFLNFDKYMAVDAIKQDVSRFNFISSDTYSLMKVGFKQSDFDAFYNIFDECNISYTYPYVGTVTATFADGRTSFRKDVVYGYRYYSESFTSKYINIPRCLCFNFVDSSLAETYGMSNVFVTLPAQMIVELSLYDVDSFSHVDNILNWLSVNIDKFDSATLDNMYLFLKIALEHSYDFEYTFYLPDDSTIDFANAKFRYSGVTDVVSVSDVVNFTFCSVSDTQ